MGSAGNVRHAVPMSSDESQARRYAAIARLLLRHGRSDLVSGADLDGYARRRGRRRGGDHGQGRAVRRRPGVDGADVHQAGAAPVDPVRPAPGGVHDRTRPAAGRGRALRRGRRPADDLSRAARRRPASLSRSSTPSRWPLRRWGRCTGPRCATGARSRSRSSVPASASDVQADMATLARIAALADKGRAGSTTASRACSTSSSDRCGWSWTTGGRRATCVRFAELTQRLRPAGGPGTRPRSDHVPSVLTMDFIEGRKVTDVGPLGLLDIDAGADRRAAVRRLPRSILDRGVPARRPAPGQPAAHRRRSPGASSTSAWSPTSRRGSRRRSCGCWSPSATTTASRRHGSWPTWASHSTATTPPPSATTSRTWSPTRSPRAPDLQAGRVLVELSRISGVHGLRPPPEMSMVGKALLNLDQVDHAPRPRLRARRGDPARTCSHILRDGLRTSPGDLVTAALDAKEFTVPATATRQPDPGQPGRRSAPTPGRRHGRGAPAHRPAATRQPADARGRSSPPRSWARPC